MRILVLRGGALGDFLVTLPALAGLRRHWPDARLELVGNATAAALAVDRGLLDAAHSQHEARWAALHADAPLPAALADWLDGFDLVLNFWPDPDGQLARRFPLRPGQVYLTASSTPSTQPAAAHFCAPLIALGASTGDFLCALREPASVRPTRVALHPGSGSPRKNWPEDRWRALARWLVDERGLEVIVITGEAESMRPLAAVGRALHGRPLAEVADVLATCRLFIGHDSGISHLAAASGTPCVLLFGPTDPAIWAPPAPTVRVLQRGADLSAISVDDVCREVRAALVE